MASAGGRSGNYNAIGSLPFGSQNLTFDGGSERDLSSGCAICGLDDDHARMLVCDGCNAEYHMYCLTPALSNIPENNWYCDSCCRRDASSPSEWKGTGTLQNKYRIRVNVISDNKGFYRPLSSSRRRGWFG